MGSTSIELRVEKQIVKKNDKYIGKRVKRGLFKGSDFVINADVNGAINILRKVIGDGFLT